jgi:hypothetical protein
MESSALVVRFGGGLEVQIRGRLIVYITWNPNKLQKIQVAALFLVLKGI